MYILLESFHFSKRTWYSEYKLLQKRIFTGDTSEKYKKLRRLRKKNPCYAYKNKTHIIFSEPWFLNSVYYCYQEQKIRLFPSGVFGGVFSDIKEAFSLLSELPP